MACCSFFARPLLAIFPGVSIELEGKVSVLTQPEQFCIVKSRRLFGFLQAYVASISAANL